VSKSLHLLSSPESQREATTHRVAFMTVQTDGSSAAAETCPVTGCCHAVLIADCSVGGEAALVHLSGRHIQRRVMLKILAKFRTLCPPTLKSRGGVGEMSE